MKEVRAFVSVESEGASIVPYRFMVPDVKEILKEHLESMVLELTDHWGGVHVYFNTKNGTLEDKIYQLIDWDEAQIIKHDIKSPDFDPVSYWVSFGRQRIKEIEHLITASEKDALAYAKSLRAEDWLEFTDEELLRSPVFMFYYAKDVCQGRLPDHLDNAMNMMSFKFPDDQFIKRYFATKKYRVRSRKSRVF